MTCLFCGWRRGGCRGTEGPCRAEPWDQKIKRDDLDEMDAQAKIEEAIRASMR